VHVKLNILNLVLDIVDHVIVIKMIYMLHVQDHFKKLYVNQDSLLKIILVKFVTQMDILMMRVQQVMMIVLVNFNIKLKLVKLDMFMLNME
jgi:hypothetical protein